VTSRSRTPLIIGGVVLIVVIAALVAVLATRGGGDDDDAGGSTAPSTITYGKVTVQGTVLPPGQGDQDPSIGAAVPTIDGTDYAGQTVKLAPGSDGPLMIVVMAHWCPHCNREVPQLIEWQKSGKVPDGLRVVGISTAVAPDRDHFPPGQWLQQLGWTWPVIDDDEQQTAAGAVGTTGYPFIMFVDAKGTLMFRVAAELPLDEVQRLADAAAATAT
jgi:thiol-disulfide isomerase/thioredoxin